MSALGRVVDPALLDACERGRARFRIEVPASWLFEGADIEVTTPVFLLCAHCNGGGCGGCERSGALRTPAEAVHLRLPRLPERREFVLRIPQPFGPEHPIAQLLLEVRPCCPAAQASPGVCRVEPLSRQPSNRPEPRR